MKRYVLDPACRVRKEKFGLLFYDLRGPRLLFAETGELLSPELFLEGGAGGPLVSGAPRGDRLRVERLLESLVAKGFLREQSLR
jgi:putative mycofactocin binding protein MftB